MNYQYPSDEPWERFKTKIIIIALIVGAILVALL